MFKTLWYTVISSLTNLLSSRKTTVAPQTRKLFFKGNKMDLLRNLTSNGNPTSPLTVDTSVAKVFTSSNGSPRWQDESRTPSPTATTPSSTSSEEQFLRRRRSNSECLLLAKNRGGHELPGPCQEYISSIKQILARSEDSHRRDLTGIAQRHRSMSLKNSPTMKEQVIR